MPTLLTADNLTFAYDAAPVLAGVSLSLAAGEVVAIIGPNGSGKSTLIKALLGHLRPSSGTVRWDDVALTSWSRRDLARRVAYLPQTPRFDPEHRVIDVLKLGRAPYWRTFGIESADDLAIVSRVAKSIDLDALLNRPMDKLSGGQRQRVFVGRCLVQEPAAMLLDEPNTFLDLRHQVELGRFLRSLAREKGMGILFASHDLNLAGAFADRIVLLSTGKVIIDGTPGNVLRPDVLSEAYGVEMARIDRDSNVPLVFPLIDDSRRTPQA